MYTVKYWDEDGAICNHRCNTLNQALEFAATISDDNFHSITKVL